MRKSFVRLGVPRERWGRYRSTGNPAPDVSYGVGVLLRTRRGSVGKSKLGDHVAVRGGSQISHDCTVENFVIIGVNAVVCGYVTVREGAHIAPGALILDGIISRPLQRCRIGRRSGPRRARRSDRGG